MGKLPQSTSIIIQFFVYRQSTAVVSFGVCTCTRQATRFIAFCSPTNRKSSSQSVGFRRIQRQENEAEVLFILCDDHKHDDAEFAAGVSRRCVVSCCGADDAKGKR